MIPPRRFCSFAVSSSFSTSIIKTSRYKSTRRNDKPMFSNTANNSASDNVNTRPKLKAYLTFMESAKKFVETHKQKIALAIGYLLVAGLFFGLGRFSIKSDPPEITIDEPTIDL